MNSSNHLAHASFMLDFNSNPPQGSSSQDLLNSLYYGMPRKNSPLSDLPNPFEFANPIAPLSPRPSNFSDVQFPLLQKKPPPQFLDFKKIQPFYSDSTDSTVSSSAYTFTAASPSSASASISSSASLYLPLDGSNNIHPLNDRDPHSFSNSLDHHFATDDWRHLEGFSSPFDIPYPSHSTLDFPNHSQVKPPQPEIPISSSNANLSPDLHVLPLEYVKPTALKPNKPVCCPPGFEATGSISDASSPVSPTLTIKDLYNTDHHPLSRSSSKNSWRNSSLCSASLPKPRYSMQPTSDSLQTLNPSQNPNHYKSPDKTKNAPPAKLRPENEYSSNFHNPEEMAFSPPKNKNKNKSKSKARTLQNNPSTHDSKPLNDNQSPKTREKIALEKLLNLIDSMKSLPKPVNPPTFSD